MTQQYLPFRPARPNLLIEAGAGTGKTTEIVKEAVSLLLEHPDLEPERLVLITFTEKAAAEIGERIRDAITDLYTSFDSGPARWPSDYTTPIISVPPEKAARYRAACARHLERLDKIRSQTIHAFCQGILKMFPLDAGVDANFRIVEGYERSRLLQETWTAWLDHETVRNPTEEWLEDWETVLEHFAGLDRVRESIFELLEKHVLVTDDRYSLGDFADARDVIRGSIEVSREFRGFQIESVEDPAGKAVLRHLHDVEPPLSDSIAEWREYFAPIAEALADVDFRDVPKQMRDPLRCLREENSFPSIYDLLSGQQAAVALRKLARRFIVFLDAEKQRLGVLDFDDLLLRTAELLEDEKAAAAVRARYDYIFIDEFQDTDRVQARIVDRLARNQAGELVHGRVVLVGDPKQSIYAFRHADPETYRDTLATFAAAGAVQRTLTSQFRSEPTLVQSLNTLFSALFSTGGNTNVYRPLYHQLDPARSPSGIAPPHLLFLRASATAEDDESGAAGQEGRAIASYIRDEIAGGRSYRDFAILLRKMANVQAFLDALDRWEIPYVLPPSGALLETRPIVDLLCVLRGIAAPYDLGAVISAARTPYFGLDDNEIVNGVLAGESPAFAEFEGALARYRQMSGSLSVSGLIDRLIAESEIELVYGVSKGGGEWLRFLERFREMAGEFDLTTGGSLAQFVDELLRRREGSEETQPMPIDDGRDAVRIMTVHGAKGLEFPIVILPELGAKTKEDMLSVFAIQSPPRLIFTGTVATLSSRYLSLGDDQVPAKVGSERKSAETDRLFYVAVTRAQQKVVFVWSPERWLKHSFFKRVANLFGWEKGVDPFNAQRGMVQKALMVGDRPVPVGFITPTLTDSNEVVSRFTSRVIEDLIAGGVRAVGESEFPAAEAPLARAEVMQRAAATKNRAAGILLHRMLELWDGDSSSLDPVLRDLGREQAADSRTLEVTRKRLETLRRSSDFERIMRASLHGRETTIYYTGEDGSAVEARIDRLIEDPDGDLIVVDFKSGTAYESRRATDRDQVGRYCAAIARMTGRTCRGLLWYIDAESDELVEVA